MSSAKTLEIERMKETLAKERIKETLEKETKKEAFEKLGAQYAGMLPFPFLTCSLTVVVQIHYNECTAHTVIYCKSGNFCHLNIFAHCLKSKN